MFEVWWKVTEEMKIKSSSITTRFLLFFSVFIFVTCFVFHNEISLDVYSHHEITSFIVVDWFLYLSTYIFNLITDTLFRFGFFQFVSSLPGYVFVSLGNIFFSLTNLIVFYLLIFFLYVIYKLLRKILKN